MEDSSAEDRQARVSKTVEREARGGSEPSEFRIRRLQHLVGQRGIVDGARDDERADVLATPHVGYVSDGLYKMFYEDTVSNIRKWLDTH